ncbi:MAG TPA: cytochrome P450 [Actinopolymorphaceae bacterium]|nr:cytochrome P450 [Actinopolymorphaceae bacterium]
MLSALPRAVVALRMRIFAVVNGDEGIRVPGPLVGPERFRAVYSHPAANGRSRGAGLSDLFWYWLAPGPQVHQEHLEAGQRYDAVARTTRRFLARPKGELTELTERCTRRILDELDRERSMREPGGRLIRLRDLMMPIWAEIYYELVFAEPCPAQARALVVGNATDVITALKCCGLRHMERRERLTDHLRTRLTTGGLAHPLPAELSAQEQVWYVQGTFFNTAVVQMSEAMTHLLLAIAQHPDVQARLVAHPDDDAYADQVIDETLRCFPLFGIAHRITTDQIVVDERTTLPAGSVLCFNYPAYHALPGDEGGPPSPQLRSRAVDQPERFDPDRWGELAHRDAHHIPFGVQANRPCPARGIAPAMMRVVAREVLRRYALYSTATHTRSIPNRGPCLLVSRDLPSDPSDPSDERRRTSALARMRARDQWEDVWRSLIQLVLGTFMVLDARHQRLCQRYFESVDALTSTGMGARKEWTS